MPIELSHLMELALGKRSELPVGNLPEMVAKHYGCHPAIVFLGHKELIHIVSKHDRIDREEIQLLHIMIKNGGYFKNPDDKNRMTVIYTNPDTKKNYLIGIKSTMKGGEVWISTLFPASRSRLGRKNREDLYLFGPKDNMALPKR